MAVFGPIVPALMHKGKGRGKDKAADASVTAPSAPSVPTAPSASSA